MMLGFTARTAFSEDVVVRAQIDGRSRLVLTPTRIYWHHLEYGRPGCCGDPSPKTTIGNIQWLPKWPTTGNSGIRSSGLAVATTFVGKQVSLTLQQARGSVYILQQPSTENGREMVIEFHDYQGGEAWYQIAISGISIQLLPDIEIRVSALELSWNSELGKFYQVQSSNNMSEGKWINVGESILGTGLRMTSTQNVLIGKADFFRIIPE